MSRRAQGASMAVAAGGPALRHSRTVSCAKEGSEVWAAPAWGPTISRRRETRAAARVPARKGGVQAAAAAADRRRQCTGAGSQHVCLPGDSRMVLQCQ